MENKERIKKLPEVKYLVTFRIRKPTFEAMLEKLESAYKGDVQKRRLSEEVDCFGYADYYAWILSQLPYNGKYRI